MKQADRQLLGSLGRASAAGGQAASGRDEPIERLDGLRSGVARIVGKAEGGLYTITELWWDGQAEEWFQASWPLGLVEAEAADYAASTMGAVGQVVRFWEQRCVGGEVRRLIDVAGGWGGTFRAASFCVHYSGSAASDVFYAVPGCQYAMVEIGLDVRRCSGHTLAEDHPAWTELGVTGGEQGQGWCNALATWAGGDWVNLKYLARNTVGQVEGDGINGINDFRIQCRVAGGELEFRVFNQSGTVISVVVVGAMRITSCPEPPGTAEIGNCCCHDDDWGTV